MGTDDHATFFHQTLTELLASRGPREFAETLRRRLGTRIRFDAAELFLYSPASHAFTPVGTEPVDVELAAALGTQLPAEGTIKQAAARGREPMRCDDLAASEWAEGAAVGRLQREASCLVAPLLVREGENGSNDSRLIAVMFIAAWSRGAFNDEDRDLAGMLGREAGPVLEHILAAEERDTLRQIAESLMVGSIGLETLIPSIKASLAQVLPHDMTCLVRFTKESGSPWFEILHTDGARVDLEALRRFPFERMAPAEILRSGRPVLVTGQQHEPFKEMSYFESIGIRSGMLCPLVVRGEPYGFLAIGNQRRNAFSERDLGLAEQISRLLSQAVANILAYEEIRALKEQAERENLYLREEVSTALDLRELVGTSPALQAALQTIERVAPTDTAVLITGETGTGKELVAMAIHQLSPRKGRPLIKVNCAALPTGLIESELFGHEKGAFTHAVTKKIGRFELADGGTIFLDEVAELPLEAQAKLLRILENQELERVGGSTTRKLDLRVLAATNLDLDEAVKAGKVRADLYYRLNVFPLRLPPLRERREDIPLLVRHFAKKYAARHRKDVTKVDSGTMKALTAYAWPGNVRELEHVIERAVILAQGSVLKVEGLAAPDAGTTESARDEQVKTLADAERQHILQVLTRTNWIIAGNRGAAAQLGMKRSTLQHRMKKLGISKPIQAQPS